MCFHGQGGYDFATIYNMPVWLRKFTFKKLKDHYDTVSGANSEDYLVNEGVDVKHSKKPKIPEAVKQAYTVKGPKPKK